MNSTFKNKLLSIVSIVLAVLFIISFSISAVIVARPFYYLEIKLMDLDGINGYEAGTARRAYDEMLDYCLGKSEEFGTGSLRWSLDGKLHFDDCKKLFSLCFNILIISSLLLAVIFIYLKKTGGHLYRFRDKGALFYSGSGLLISIAAVFGLCAIDFDKAFETFHHIFFPGKENWIFDWYADEIIRVLPEEFFMHCAILIAFLIFLLCGICIKIGLRKKCDK